MPFTIVFLCVNLSQSNCKFILICFFMFYLLNKVLSETCSNHLVGNFHLFQCIYGKSNSSELVKETFTPIVYHNKYVYDLFNLFEYSSLWTKKLFVTIISVFTCWQSLFGINLRIRVIINQKHLAAHRPLSATCS